MAVDLYYLKGLLKLVDDVWYVFGMCGKGHFKWPAT